MSEFVKKPSRAAHRSQEFRSGSLSLRTKKAFQDADQAQMGTAILYFNANSPKFKSALPTTLSDSIATIKVVLLDLPASQAAGPRLLLPFPVLSTSRTSISKLKTLAESKVKCNTILKYDALQHFSFRNSTIILTSA